MAQQSARRGWDNQGFPQCFKHASGDLDPVRELPYRPAAVFLAASKAGQMTASDHAQQRSQRFPLPEGGRPQMENPKFVSAPPEGAFPPYKPGNLPPLAKLKPVENARSYLRQPAKRGAGDG